MRQKRRRRSAELQRTTWTVGLESVDSDSLEAMGAGAESGPESEKATGTLRAQAR